MHALVRETQELHDKLHRAYNATYAHLLKLRDFDQTKLTQGDRADLALLTSDVAKLLEDLRKEANAVRAKLDKIVCMVWATQVENDETSDRSVRGELAIATPRIKMIAKLPHPERDRDEYAALVRAMGFDAPRSGCWWCKSSKGKKQSETTVADSPLVRLHWPAVRDWITQLAEQGKPLPDGIKAGETFPEYSTTVKRLKGGSE